jgi:secreted PhoX family phosphatase
MRAAAAYRWHEHDERFDAGAHPNEPNRFGWVVEIDPIDPASTPVKRTALGRAAHEGAWVAVTRDGRAVVYSGEDAASSTSTSSSAATASLRPAAAPGQPQLLDHGTLYVARFDADGSGRWLPLVHGQGPLTAGQRLCRPGRGGDQGAPGQRPAGRPRRWTARVAGHRPHRRWVYCTLTNNSARGGAGARRPTRPTRAPTT